MDTSVYERRREKLRTLLYKNGVNALLVQSAADRYYLSGFELHDSQPNESSGWLVITDDGKDWLCTDSRYHDAAKRVWQEEQIFIYKGDAPEQVSKLLGGKIKSLDFDGRHITLDVLERLSPSLGLRRKDGLVETLRVLKEDEEIARIEASCKINHDLMAWVPTILLPGKTEKEIAWEIEQFFRNNGAEEQAFAGIVAINGNAALPHAIPGNDRITKNCSVLIDVGCRYLDYCSDQTRTFWVGDKPSSAFLFNLEAVQKAQMKAIEIIEPGIKVSEVYAAAKRSLDKDGVGDFFTHGLGHGVGLETHEAPSLGGSADTLLKPGMIITVEPGVYYSGEFGIRWEYMVAVTKKGCRIL